MVPILPISANEAILANEANLANIANLANKAKLANKASNGIYKTILNLMIFQSICLHGMRSQTHHFSHQITQVYKYTIKNYDFQ